MTRPLFPEQQSAPSYHPLEVGYFDALVRQELREIIRTYESFYLPKPPFHVSEERIDALSQGSLTKERYAYFERWMGELLKQGHLPSIWDSKDSPTIIQDDIKIAVTLFEALSVLRRGGEMPDALREAFAEHKLLPQEFFLKNVPVLSRLPSQKEMKNVYKLNYLEEDFAAGRPTSDFALTENDLSQIDYEPNDGDDHWSTVERLREFQEGRYEGEYPPAQIFSIRDLVAKKRRRSEATGRFDDIDLRALTTKELFAAFDEANVRPATLEELLAFSATYWKPFVWGNDPQIFQHRWQIPVIYALGSPFTQTSTVGNGAGKRSVPRLAYAHALQERQLSGYRSDSEAGDLNMHWLQDNFFLVFRKPPVAGSLVEL